LIDWPNYKRCINEDEKVKATNIRDLLVRPYCGEGTVYTLTKLTAANARHGDSR
jgi:hypothetical protein